MSMNEMSPLLFPFHFVWLRFLILHIKWKCFVAYYIYTKQDWSHKPVYCCKSSYLRSKENSMFIKSP